MHLLASTAESYVGDYIPFTSDARVGTILMGCAIVGIGAIYGFRLSRGSKDFRLPLLAKLSISILVFVYYLGILMYTPTSLGPITLVGLYAYLAYALTTVGVGFVLTLGVTFVWALIFKTSVTVHEYGSRFSNSLMSLFDMLIERYYKKNIAA